MAHFLPETVCWDWPSVVLLNPLVKFADRAQRANVVTSQTVPEKALSLREGPWHTKNSITW